MNAKLTVAPLLFALLLSMPRSSTAADPTPYLQAQALAAQVQKLERRNARLYRKLAKRERQLARAHRDLRARWNPTVYGAIRLASAVTGVSQGQMYAVARCESNLYPYATNGRYKGLFQLGWSPFGLSPFDPYANALSAAVTVRHDGGWRQWECQP